MPHMHKGGLPIGSIRKWATGMYQKVAPGEWMPYDPDIRNQPIKDKPKEVHDLFAQHKPQSAPLIKQPQLAIPPAKPIAASIKPSVAPAVKPIVALPPKNTEWVPYSPDLPKDTLAAHTDKYGKLTPERKDLQKGIVASFFKDAKKPQQDKRPLAIMTMGGPASGKSTILNAMPKDGFVTINADDVKEFLPEFSQAIEKKAKNAANMVHAESISIAARIRDKAINEGYNIVYDGTGKNAAYYMSLMDQLRARGYHIHLIMPDIDVDTALEENEKRAEKTGRFVPPHIIKDAYSAIPGNFEKIARKADSFALYDRRREPPVKVWERTQDGKEVVHDPEFVNNFRKENQQQDVEESLIDSTLLAYLIEQGAFDFEDSPNLPYQINDLHDMIEKSWDIEKKMQETLPSQFDKNKDGVEEPLTPDNLSAEEAIPE